MEGTICHKKYCVGSKTIATGFYELFWIYVICGIAGFCIETVWCWIDFQEFTSRTSNLFFPISCVWGFGGVILCIGMERNRWEHWAYLFVKCVILGTVFEFICGYLGERLLEVTFWDYSGMPLHMGKYINLPFCVVWGLTGVLWVKRVHPFLKEKLSRGKGRLTGTGCRFFIIFMVVTQVLTGTALLRMHGRQEGLEPSNTFEYVLDSCFTDQVLQTFFPKMKNVFTGEKIYQESEEIVESINISETKSR